jgi:hypothetical protein
VRTSLAMTQTAARGAGLRVDMTRAGALDRRVRARIRCSGRSNELGRGPASPSIVFAI